MVDTPEQAGVIAHRRNGRGIEILLVTSRSSGRWIIPKGNIESHLGPRESAAMEAFEEGGIKGYVHPHPLGVYEHGNDERRPLLVFRMEVRQELDDWPERHERERRWVTPADAMQAVEEDGLKELIAQVVEIIS